jgi:hypothetical protein
MSESSKTYPRGLPYKPPEPTPAVVPEAGPPGSPPPAAATTTTTPVHDLAAQQALLRRWIQILIFATMAALAVIVGTAFVVINQIKSQVQAARNEPPAARPEPLKPGDKIDLPAPKDEKRTTPPEKREDPKTVPEPDKPETQRDRFMGALGNLTGIHLYQAYLNIGLLADCTEGEVYTMDEAGKWLERTVAQLEQVDKQLDVLAKADLDTDEKQGIDRCRQASALLRTQAMELREYWKNSDKDHAMRYHKARDAAWTSISDVLQIPKE